MHRFLYFHGFASGPGSQKAQVFKRRFEAKGIDLVIPDLEGGDFQTLTISRQMKVIKGLLADHPKDSFALIGSSMGGYLAALTAHTSKQVEGMYLMAPGFNFLKRWRSVWEKGDAVNAPRASVLKVFNYRHNKLMSLDSNIFSDAEVWDAMPLTQTIPTRIVHGIHDDTVPIEESRKFVKLAKDRECVELDDDHSLLKSVDWIVEDCLGFFGSRGFFTV
ncbi:MAG: alpha/beta fold hydrolase [Candidatus Nitrohelix vancouverensis]|uniref:Alpha/beta fold hydrolase n=1 Tax=Candidatus Nitrohelix vancouverensis TaxID=2705534 RepID=A0A7T0C421_9BACT|nr:MAG: alpha/beta fold hydrolase [Candidatus Nitrohelix vancouverensis]